MRKPDLLLHIGTEKTGTTTIQESLRRSREPLAAAGVLFPKSIGTANHTRLAAYAETVPWGMSKRFFGVDSEARHTEFRQETRSLLAAELASGSWDLVVMSNEHLHSQLTTPRQVTALAEWLAPLFERITVLIYLRRQDQLAASRYSTALRAGLVPSSHFDVGPAGRYYFDHHAIYKNWATRFSAANVHVRLFGKSHFLNGQLIDDFTVAARLPTTVHLTAVTHKNESLSADAAALVLALNRKAAGGALGLAPRQRRRLIDAIAGGYPGAPHMPLRAAAIAFYERFKDSNAALRAALIDPPTPWFDDDFTMYPDFHDRLHTAARTKWAEYELDRILPRLLAEAD